MPQSQYFDGVLHFASYLGFRAVPQQAQTISRITSVPQHGPHGPLKNKKHSRRAGVLNVKKAALLIKRKKIEYRSWPASLKLNTGGLNTGGSRDVN